MRTILLLLLALVAANVLATDQMPDVVRLDGRNYELSFHIRSNALSIYDCKEPKVPRLAPAHTACYRGYVGRWEVRTNSLLLVDLHETYDKNGDAVTNRFAELFPGHKTGVVARWFTGVLKLNEPRCYGYVCDPPDMTFDHEVYVEVVEGKVRSSRHVDNSDKVRAALRKGLEETNTKYRQQNAQPDGPANGSQPIRAETNRTSSAAGSRR